MAPDSPNPEPNLTPDTEATRMVEEMVDATDLQRQILVEAAQTGTESGRSVCGSEENAKEPGDRSFGSVVLKGCPLSNRGLMHGGGGHDFSTPEHSLLDMANVVFGAGTASLVVGNERSDVFLSTSSDQSDALTREFQNALGVDVTSADEVAAALSNGEIPHPARARERFRRAVPKLFMEVETPHPDIAPSTPASTVLPSPGLLEDALAAPSVRANNIRTDLGTLFGQNIRFDPSDIDINLAQVLTSQLTDAVVLMFFLYVVGGSPRSLVQENVSST